jgi:hypothetical protein
MPRLTAQVFLAVPLVFDAAHEQRVVEHYGAARK